MIGSVFLLSFSLSFPLSSTYPSLPEARAATPAPPAPSGAAAAIPPAASAVAPSTAGQKPGPVYGPSPAVTEEQVTATATQITKKAADDLAKAQDENLATVMAEMKRQADDQRQDLEARLRAAEEAVGRQDAIIARLAEVPRIGTARAGLSLTGFVQADGAIRQSSQDQANPSTGAPLNQDRISIRRARLRALLERTYVAGALELDGNTTRGATARLISAEASLRWPGPSATDPTLAMVTIGLFKTPFGFEVLQSDRDRLFMERSTAERGLFPGELPLVTSSDVGDFFPIPRYDDYQARLQISMRRDEELSATFLGSDDHLRRTIPESDPADERTQNTDDSYRRLYVRYTRLLPDGSSFFVTPSVGVDHSSSLSRFGDTNVSLVQDTWQYAVRGGYRRRLGARAILSFGIDAQARHTSSRRDGSVNLPPREGDIVVFGQRPSGEIASDRWTADIVSVAPYLLSEITLGRLTVTPGLRFEPTLIEGDHQLPYSDITPPVGYSRLDLPRNPGVGDVLGWAPNPRLSLSFRVLPRLTLMAGGGIYGQPPDPEDMSPVFGNPALNLSRATHVSGGFSWKLRPTLVFETVGFWKRLDELVSRSALPSPPVAQALTQDGRGRTFGVQALLRQELVRGFFGWVTYTYSRSERRDHPTSDWRLFD